MKLHTKCQRHGFSSFRQEDNYVPPPWGRGHIVLSVDPVGGGGGGVATCLHSISLNGQILVKLTQIYHWEGEKC